MQRSIVLSTLVLGLSLLHLSLLSGCGESSVSLTVDVLSDWVPGIDFVAVQTELATEPFDGTDSSSEVRQETYVTDGTESFLRGIRVAELDEVGRGRRFVRVSLRSAAGSVIAQRVLDVTFSESFAATLLLTRSCAPIVCPAASGAPELTECQAGECVDPRCSPSTPDPALCPTACEADADCDLAWCEGTVLCRSGGCLCEDESGPADAGPPDTGPVDAGPADSGPDAPVCPPTETACTDGLDDDCDGLTDCADPDCVGASCDDGFFCTTNDRCSAAGACSDTTPTCPSFCNEATARCEECTSDRDCGSPTTGAWGSCGGFSGTCGESGTRSRSVMTPRCSAGTCTVATSSETGACNRNTDGTTCGTTTTGSWGGCGGFADACDTTGSQNRTITAFRCAAGGCAAMPTTESRGCSRTVANGTACGGGYCCSNTCVPRNSNNHCGVCGLNCAAQGQTCTNAISNNGSRHNLPNAYVCTCPGLNSTCVAIGYGASATCFDGHCQCQCPATGPTSCGGQCAAGTCFEDTIEPRSDNFCGY